LATCVARADRDGLEALAAEAPEGLCTAVRDRYRSIPGERGQLARFLRHVAGDEATGVLLALLSEAAGGDAEGLRAALAARGARVPVREVRRLLDDPLAAESAAEAAGLAGYDELVPLLRERLRRSEIVGAAAVALARMRAASCTRDIVDMAPRVQEDADYEQVLEALELMDDPAAVAPLLDWLPDAPDHRVRGIDSALRALTGRDPHVDDDPDDIRARWAQIDHKAPPSPSITDLRVLDPTRASMTLHDGARLVVFDDEPPAWSWDLRVGDERIYRTGSRCSTCATWLEHLGWPGDRAVAGSATLRRRLTHVPHLTEDLLEDVAPLLGVLRTGRLMVTLVDLDLEQVTSDAASWFTRRHALREPEEDDEQDEPDGPGTPHFQLRTRIPGPEPTFCSVLPTQPLDSLDEATIARHAAAIEAGHRPAAVLMSWADQKFVECSYPERFLLNVVLDGHHKLAAYSRLHIPARALLVFRIADSTFAPEERADFLREVTAPLLTVA
jgi:hypothetical protein